LTRGCYRLSRRKQLVAGHLYTVSGQNKSRPLNRNYVGVIVALKGAVPTEFRILVSVKTSSRFEFPSAIIFIVCGRYRLSRRKQLVEEYFDAPSDEPEWTPRYNIAPTQPVPIIRQNPAQPRRELSLMRWGLIPSWAKDMSGAALMINARSETAATKPAFREPLTNRRCLVPADGFYEWQKTGKVRQPYCFEVNDRELFAFAGLWDRWKDPSGQWVRTCSILTTGPNAVTSSVHDRMPVILDVDNYDLWLDPGMTNVEAVSGMLKPYDARQMRSYPVSTRINHVANDDAECSTVVELRQIQNRLF